MAETRSEYTSPTRAMTKPPMRNAAAAPIVPASFSHPAVRAARPMPITAPEPMDRMSALPSDRLSRGSSVSPGAGADWLVVVRPVVGSLVVDWLAGDWFAVDRLAVDWFAVDWPLLPGESLII